MTKYADETSNFGANGPFFRVIREGLAGLADGEDYFDLLANDVVFEYIISVPGYPRLVEGRQNVIDLYRSYDDYMTVHAANNLRIYRDPEASVVVLEYEVHGTSVQPGWADPDHRSTCCESGWLFGSFRVRLSPALNGAIA
jgi:hypothetical protein